MNEDDFEYPDEQERIERIKEQLELEIAHKNGSARGWKPSQVKLAAFSNADITVYLNVIYEEMRGLLE